MSDLDQGQSEPEDNSVFFEEDTENWENSSIDSSKTPSPTDDETTDPNFVCNLAQVESPTERNTRRTRRRSTGEIPTPSPELRTYNLFLTDTENEAAHANSTAAVSQTHTYTAARRSSCCSETLEYYVVVWILETYIVHRLLI